MIKVAVSDLPRVMACAGSVALVAQAKLKRPPEVVEDDAQREGTAAHWVAEQRFKGNTADLVGKEAPNGYVVDAEMQQHADAYFATFNMSELVHRVESRGKWEGPGFVLQGQSDLVLRPSVYLLVVNDFKYGFRIVEAEGNWQTIGYAIIEVMGLQPGEPAPTEFVLGIYQPRPFHPDGPFRFVRITAYELFVFYQQISERLTAISNGLDLTTSGPHCHYCPANANCPTFLESTYNAIDASRRVKVILDNPAYIRPVLDEIDRAMEVLKNAKEAYEEEATSRMKRGEQVPNMRVEPRLANTTWRGGIGQIESATGLSLTEPKPITPAEAKRRGMTDEQIATHTHRPSIGIKLVRTDAEKERKRAEKLFKAAEKASKK